MDPCSLTFLFWVIRPLRQGFQRVLKREDIPPLPSKSSLSCDYWEIQENSIKRNKLLEKYVKLGAFGIVKCIWKLQKIPLLLGIFFAFIQGILFSIGRPLLLRLVISEIQNGTVESALYVVLAFAILILCEAIVQTLSKQLLSSVGGAQFTAWISTALVTKACRINSAYLSASKISEVNLLSKDILRTVEDFKWGCLVFYSLTSLVGAIISLAIILGVPCLPGILVIFMIFLLNTRITKRTKSAEKSDAAIGDKRVSLTGEVLKNIFPIKLSAWEEPFKNLVQSAREQEMIVLFRFRALTITTINLGRASPVLATCASILTLALGPNKETLNAAAVFSAIAAFTALRLPLISIPSQMVQLTSAAVCFKRLSDFLLLPEMEKVPICENSDFCLIAENVSFSWSLIKKQQDDMKSLSSFSVSNIKIHIPRHGALIAIIGSVASGKSTLLQGLLGTCASREGGVMEIPKRVGYAPQQPLILAASIRENIILGSPFDENLYHSCIERSQFALDLLEMPDGDATEVGERGRTLSGGQQARLSLARAFYFDPELLLLDCPLAAIDPIVALKIFANGIWGFARESSTAAIQQQPDSISQQLEMPSNPKKNRSVLMVLSEYRFLKYFTHIIVLESGSIVEQGSFSKLSSDPDSKLSELLVSEENENDVQDKAILEESSLDENTKLVKKKNSSSTTAVVSNPPPSMQDLNSIRIDQDGKFASRLVEKEIRNREMNVQEWILDWGKGNLFLSALLGMAAYGFLVANDLWLAAWVSASSSGMDSYSSTVRAAVYASLTISAVIFVELLSVNNIRGAVRASKTLHAQVLDHLLFAPIEWHEKTPSGRILSRLSADLSLVDRMLGHIADDVQQFFWNIMGLVIVTSIIIPPIAAVNVVSIGLFGLLFVFVNRSNQECKSFGNIALSPIVTNLNECGFGRVMIHSTNSEAYFIKKHVLLMDEFIKYSYFSSSLINFGTLTVGFIGFILSTCAAIILVVIPNYNPALVGLALNYCFSVPYFLGILSITLPMLMQGFATLQRVMELKSKNIPQESRNGETPKNWPSKGFIKFENVELRYRADLNPAIKDLSFDVPPQTNCVIVGRTGAGKSSIISLLFRVREASSGRILIDDKDISKVTLKCLRENLAIVPQDPLLLSANIRTNIDPFNSFTDEQVGNVLERVGLAPKRSLYDTATNLSSGEKQLLNAARLILTRKHVKIVVLDELSAQLDSISDQILMNRIRAEFSHATLITIAHRLDNTLPFSGLVILLDKGKLVEYGHPTSLLKIQGGSLRQLVMSSSRSLFHSMQSSCGPPPFSSSADVNF